MSYPILPPDQANIASVTEMLNNGTWFYPNPDDGTVCIFKDRLTGKFALCREPHDRDLTFDTLEELAVFVAFAGCDYV